MLDAELGGHGALMTVSKKARAVHCHLQLQYTLALVQAFVLTILDFKVTEA